MLEDTIIQCVLATTQTYVDSLKKEGEMEALEITEMKKNKGDREYVLQAVKRAR